MSDTRFTVHTDPVHGGRWTSLMDPDGRQWLWHRDAEGRESVRPGDAFVDVGGFEECIPTIGGNPDHGAVWSRPWSVEVDDDFSEICVVNTSDGALRRTLTAHGDHLAADYRLQGEPGQPFIWAGHGLYELAIGARIAADSGPAYAFPGHGAPVATSWPHPVGINFAQFPEDDGTAMFCVLPGRQQVVLIDGDNRLRIRLVADIGQPFGFGIWRNLGGYPWDGSPHYRNIGVEPMLGHEFDLSLAAPDRVARIPSSGEVCWRVEIDNDDRDLS